MEKEFDAIEHYSDNITSCRYETFLRDEDSQRKCRDGNFQSCCGETRRKLNLPKLELNTFDGDIRNWLRLCDQFKKIDENE